jgi:hypothetical protein
LSSPHAGPPELEEPVLGSPELDDVSGSPELDVSGSPDVEVESVPVLSRPTVSVVSPAVTVVGFTVIPVVSSPLEVDSVPGTSGMSSEQASRGQVRSK